MYGCDSVATLDLSVSATSVALIIQTGNDLLVTAASSYFWSTSEVSQIITPITIGWYWCVITDLNGCISDTAFYEVTNIGTAIGEANISDLSLYPNPTKGIVNIVFSSNLSQNLSVRIVNVIGENVFIDDLNQFVGEYSKQIDLSNNAKGIYFLEIEASDGIINKKLILQ
jgi:hypothetical protein